MLRRVIGSIIGVLLLIGGTIWILQGLNIAFKVGFMVGDRHWALYGAIADLVGLALLAWAWRKPTPVR